MLETIKKYRNAYILEQKQQKQRKLYHNSIGKYIVSATRANEGILHILQKSQPAFITRFGSSELATIIFFLHERKKVQQPGIWNDHHRHILCDISGFFPFTPEAMDAFAQMYLSFLNNIDVLGVWNVGEEHIKQFVRPDITFVPLAAIEPYYFDQPWSKALSGKKILVIHPFAESIRQQYNRRTLLFQNKDVLPTFDLQVFPAVQTVADNTQGFKDWFSALEYMCEEIGRKEFDVAIIGAGAYGMPLANFIKTKMGKIAIHMGGATQILFGIKGKRWENIPSVNALYNENWISPSFSERPAGLETVEGGCYW